jgi:hypothetical protein
MNDEYLMTNEGRRAPVFLSFVIWTPLVIRRLCFVIATAT